MSYGNEASRTAKTFSSKREDRQGSLYNLKTNSIEIVGKNRHNLPKHYYTVLNVPIRQDYRHPVYLIVSVNPNRIRGSARFLTPISLHRSSMSYTARS